MDETNWSILELFRLLKWYLYRFSWSTRKYVRFQISAANLPSLFLSSFLKSKTIKILPYCNRSVVSIQSWSLLPWLFVFNQAFCYNFGLLGLWWVVYFFQTGESFSKNQRGNLLIYKARNQHETPLEGQCLASSTAFSAFIRCVQITIKWS